MAIKKVKDPIGTCDGCCFYSGEDCTRPRDVVRSCVYPGGSYIYIDDDPDSAVAYITDEDGNIINEAPRPDQVNHPTHYNWLPSNVEAEDICEHFPWRIGAALKYLYRHQHKHDDRDIQDLKKAVNQIQKHIKRLEGDYVQYERTNERL